MGFQTEIMGFFGQARIMGKKSAKVSFLGYSFSNYKKK